MQSGVSHCRVGGVSWSDTYVRVREKRASMNPRNKSPSVKLRFGMSAPASSASSESCAQVARKNSIKTCSVMDGCMSDGVGQEQDGIEIEIGDGEGHEADLQNLGTN